MEQPSQLSIQSRAISLPPFTIPIPARYSSPSTQNTEDSSQLAAVQILSPQIRDCWWLVRKIEEHQFGFLFKWPVDTYGLGLLDYFDKVERAIDLSTIRCKLAANLYQDPNKFNEDMILMFHNALKFNKEAQRITERMNQIQTYYAQLFEEFANKYQKCVEVDQNQGVTKKSIKRRINAPPKQIDPSNPTLDDIVKQYFNQNKLKALSQKLMQIGQANKILIKNAMMARFKVKWQQKIYLPSLNGQQLMFLVEVAKEYFQEDYGCSNEQMEGYKKGKRVRKTRYGFEQQQSDFQIDDM